MVIHVFYWHLVSSWVLNTVNNVRYLEKHVSDEIEQFMQIHVEDSKDLTQYDTNVELLQSDKLTQLKKVLIFMFYMRQQSVLSYTFLKYILTVN